MPFSEVICDKCQSGDKLNDSRLYCLRCQQSVQHPKLTRNECEQQYEYHLDDGGFLIGFCVRCGYTNDCGGIGCI